MIMELSEIREFWHTTLATCVQFTGKMAELWDQKLV